jgi:hypothetical protein
MPPTCTPTHPPGQSKDDVPRPLLHPKVMEALARKNEGLQNGEITLHYVHGKVKRITRLDSELLE